MGNKIEGLLKKLGLDPTNLEPQPTGPQMQNMLAYLRKGGAEQAKYKIDRYLEGLDVEEYYLEHGQIGSGELYTFVTRRLKNGIVETAFIPNECIGLENLKSAVEDIAPGDWVPYRAESTLNEWTVQ